MKRIVILFGITCCSLNYTSAQVQVAIDVATDAYGYEIYWELVPSGNNCGTGTIFAGGNTNVGCNGGGAQVQNMSGYANNVTINEGPWSLTDGADYDIIFVDDWGDGGVSFTVNILGYPMYTFIGTGAGATFTFTATGPPAVDASVTAVEVYDFVEAGNIAVTGDIKNLGTTTITSFDLNYSIDNGATVTESIGSLSLTPFTTYQFAHSTLWNATAGTYAVKTWVSNVNGLGTDDDLSNDDMTKSVTVIAPTPNIISSYTSTTITLTHEVVGTSADQVSLPQDLDFHPNGELWVVNRGLSGNVGGGGGTTITFTDPGGTGQTSLYRKDQNSKHFMNEPSGIAFSMNGNFSTSPGMYDANFSGGSPFTGPALWSSDPLIYAQPSGGNGSHLDMLHASSYAMGIAHETENVFWIFDGNNNDIVRYDFGEDHGPGNTDHDDGRIRRYTGMSVSRINNDIGSHMELDKSSGWLYIVDNGNQRVLRLDVNSGSVGGTPTYGPYETLAEYKNVDGATWEVVVNSGLVEPSGIDVIDDRMIVTDHSSGDIIIYDISSMPAVEIKRIVTGEPGIMGTVIGPEGRIWYVNYQMNKLVKIEPSSIVGPSAITSAQSTDISCNGFSDGTITIVANGPGGSISYSIDGGNTFPDTIGVFTGLNAGSYTVAIQDVNGVLTGSTLIINEPSLLTINSESSTDISFCGATDGSITIVASGGTPNLNYVIDDGGMTFSNNSGVFSGLAAGSYLVTMVDANGCTQLGSMLTINEPPGTINIILESSVDISTCGGADGEITIVAAGGTPPLSYSIDGGVSFSNTSGVFTALSVGNYAIAIKDVSGCIQPGSTLSIDEPAAIVIANESATDVTGCLISDGTIIITASDTLGGSLNYSIDGGSTFSNTTGIFTGLSSGTYNIVVRDTNLCSKIGSTIFIDDPSTVTGVLSSSSDSLNTGIGTATVSSVAGGNSPYTYSWSNGGSSATATGLTTGTYTVTVTDASGCTYVDNVFIETTIGVNEYKEAIAEINIYPNPNQGQFKVEIEVPEEVKGISLQITNLLGQNVYFEKIRVPGGNTQISVDLSGYTTGIYYLQVLNEKSLGRTTRKLIIQK